MASRRMAWHPGRVFLGAVVALLSTAVVADSPGKQIFEQRCSRCHDLPDPETPPPEGWPKRLDLMAKLAKLNVDEKANVLDFLQSHTQKAVKTVSLAEERRLFEEKCSLCHTLERVFLIPLNEASRRHIVLRMQKRAPDWISEQEAELILDYISKASPSEHPKKPAQDAAAMFRERCTACHTLERVYLKLEAQKAPAWLHIVERMQQKAPQWLTDQEARQIVQYLQALKPVPKE